MKRTLLILLLPSAIALAQSSPGPEWLQKLLADLCANGSVLLNVNPSNEGNRQYYAASAEQLAKCPEWDGSGNPPLLLGDALELARAHLTKQNPEVERFPFAWGSIRSAGTEAYSNRWFYALEFRVQTRTTYTTERGQIGDITIGGQLLELPNEITTELMTTKSFDVYIMMDGSVVEPTSIKTDSANNTLHTYGGSAARGLR